MLKKVQYRQSSFNNKAYVARNPFLTWIKLNYYRLLSKVSAHLQVADAGSDISVASFAFGFLVLLTCASEAGADKNIFRPVGDFPRDIVLKH